MFCLLNSDIVTIVQIWSCLFFSVAKRKNNNNIILYDLRNFYKHVRVARYTIPYLYYGIWYVCKSVKAWAHAEIFLGKAHVGLARAEHEQ